MDGVSAPPAERAPARAAQVSASCPEDAVALLKTAAAIVASRMTQVGHLAQIVTQEHRGNCTVRGCTPACIEAGNFMVNADAYLTQHERPQPEQASLWEAV